MVMNSVLDCKTLMRILGCWNLKNLHVRWIGLTTAVDQNEQGDLTMGRSLKTASPGVSVPNRSWSSLLLFTLKSNMGYKSILSALICKVKVTDHTL